ncbi:MAG: hypothetical protein IS860_01975 [Nitrosopumilus sp.]|nr:hypothetical protein [Nitrosopumilus sp.]
MGKIKIRTGRGTGTIKVDDSKQKISGEEFRKLQAEKKKAAGNTRVHTGRGTGSRKLSDIPEPKDRPSTEGMTRSTGRGTGSRKSRGK